MPFFRRRLLFSVSIAALAASASTLAAAEPRTLIFGLITPRAAQQTKDNWSPFVERMGTALNMPVEIRTFLDQADFVDAFRKGDIDVGWMGNGPALAIAETRAGAVFAQMVTKEGSYGFNSVLIVPRKSTLKDLTDVLKHAKTLRFGDGDVKSASGHLVPSYFAFQKNGVNDTRAIFKTVTNNSHQKNLMAAAKGEVDVATANNEEFSFFARDYPDLAKEVRVIWTSPMIPQSPLVWKTALPVDMRRRMLHFTVNFGTKNPEEARILEKLNNLSGFRQSSNRQLVTVADLEMFKARQAINNDPKLTPEQRTQRIEETIRRGSKLDLMLKLSSASLL